jgi:hypothetical protein
MDHPRSARARWTGCPASTLGTVALLIATSAAQANIVVGRGIAGVVLGEGAPTARQSLGRRDHVQTYTAGQSWFYGGRSSRLDWVTVCKRDVVVGVETGSRREQMLQRIPRRVFPSVGQKGYRGLTCQSTAVRAIVGCPLTTVVHGKTVQTRCIVLKGHVSNVDVGIIGEF